MENVDYLIIGAGATGLAFADTLLRETDATLAIVDRNAKPGGHWNYAYDFVRLHQPSEFYGVDSVRLGRAQRDQDGWNAGLYELASGAEVLAYFDQVMADHLLPTERVAYYPNTNYLGQGQLKSLSNGQTKTLTVDQQIVDATYYGTSIPSLHMPNFACHDDVRLIPPNLITDYWARAPHLFDSVCILGAGKTAMDVGVHLLDLGLDGEQMTWVKPRDSWLLNRRMLQPGEEFFESTMRAQSSQVLALAKADSAQDLFHRLEAEEIVLRIFPEIEPSMYHCAIVSEGEIAALRQIKSIIRKGRVRRLGPSGMEFDEGAVSMPRGTLYIDCTASAVSRNPKLPIFSDDRITLQLARTCQPIFSAAMIAKIASLDLNTAEKNALCQPLPLPDTPADFFAIALANMMNQYVWTRNAELRDWMMGSRLDGFTRRISEVSEAQPSAHAILQSFRQNIPHAIANIHGLMKNCA